jgi:hypothetical protein
MVNAIAGLGKCAHAVVSGSVKVLAFAISLNKAGWTITGLLHVHIGIMPSFIGTGRHWRKDHIPFVS